MLDPQVLLSYAIDAFMPNYNYLITFIEFLKECEKKNLIPIFHRIKTPISDGFKNEINEIYSILKSMGAEQENILIKNWLIKG